MKNKKTTSSKLSFEKIWKLIQETNKQIQETNRILTEKFQETDRILTEKFKETNKKFKETEQQSKEVKEIILKQSQQTDRKFQETDKKFQETDKKLRQPENLFVGQWGKLIEALVEGKLIQLFNQRNVPIQRTAQRETSYYNGQEVEIDLVGRNGDIIVAVEVKTTLQIRDVNDFIEKLKILPGAFSEYKGKKIYGAVAFIHSNGNSQKYAYKKGLFVIKRVDNSAIILNDDKFKPVDFSKKQIQP